MPNALVDIRERILAFDTELIPLSQLAPLVKLSPPTLVKKIKRGEIDARFDRRKYWIGKEQALDLAEKNLPKIRSWERLVDVCKKLDIHRNIGEAVCRRSNLSCELDLNGHMRVSPEAEECIRDWVKDKSEKKDWVRKVDFAESLNEHPTLVDTVCRKLDLSIDHDIHGFVILSPEAQQGFLEWRENRDVQRLDLVEHKGRTYYSLSRTVEDAAAFFAYPDSKKFERITRTYYRRFSFWIRNGLKCHTINGRKYFSTRNHDLLVDDLSVAEAARVGGLSKSTVKSWIRSGALKVNDSFPKRRSLSKQQFVAALRKKYSSSPVLKKKPRVPVCILPSVEEVVQTVKFRGADGLFGALREVTELSDKAIEPMHSGDGFVPRLVLETLDTWMKQVEFGVSIDVHSEYLGIYCEELKPLAEAILAYNHLHSADELCSLVGTAVGLSAHKVEDMLFGDLTGKFLPLSTRDLLEGIQRHGGARLYSPEIGFDEGDLLVHPTAEDFGEVSRVLDMRTIVVEWRKLGQLTMVHRGRAPSGLIHLGSF